MRLLLTRTLEQGTPLKLKLEEEGYEVILFPMIRISPPADGGRALKKAVENIDRYDWLVLTSPNGVQVFATQMETPPPGLRIVAVGPQTAARLKKIGWSFHLPTVSQGEASLISFFREEKIAGQSILFPSSQIRRKAWVRAVTKLGAEVEVIEAYQTLPAEMTKKEIDTLLKTRLDAVLFFSPSQVKSFFRKIRSDDSRFTKTVFIPFGSTTAKAIGEEGGRAAFIPSEAREAFLLKELKAYFKSQG